MMIEQPKVSPGRYYYPLFQSEFIGVAILDQQFCYKSVNSRYKSLFQCDEMSRLINNSFFEKILSYECSEVEKQCAKLKSGELVSFRQILSINANDSSSIPLEISASGLYNEEGRMEECMILAKPVEQLSQIDDSRVLVNTLIEAINDLVFVVDQNMRLSTFNTLFCKTITGECGIEPKRGMSFATISDRFFGQGFLSVCNKALMGEQFSVEQSSYTINFFPVTNTENEPIGFTAYCKQNGTSDTDLISFDKSGMFKNIFEQSPIGIVISNREKPLQANQQFCDMLGYTQAEMENKTIIQLSHQEDRDKHLKAFEQLKNEEIEYFVVEKRYITKFGAVVPARTTVSRVNLEPDEHNTYVAFVEDLTEKQELKNKERELQELRERDAFAMEEQKRLREKLESMNRELSSNLMFISQRNVLLESINQSLRDISSKASYEVKHELFKISSKVKRNIQLDEAWGKFKIHFDKTHPEFFSKLRNMDSGLTQKEIKQCAYIRIGLSNKEAAQLLGVSPKSIEMARYRIKKKLTLAPAESLADFINSL